MTSGVHCDIIKTVKEDNIKEEKEMQEWKFENGIEVYEGEYDYDVHCFKVYKGNYLGTVYPETVEDMNACIERLDAGFDPISDGWEDGLGNACTLNGWGE